MCVGVGKTATKVYELEVNNSQRIDASRWSSTTVSG